MRENIKIIREDDRDNWYVPGATSNEHCKSLAKYLVKYWRAQVEEEYDVGFSAKYIVRIDKHTFLLHHDSHLGNFLSFNNIDEVSVYHDIINDLEARLKK